MREIGWSVNWRTNETLVLVHASFVSKIPIPFVPFQIPKGYKAACVEARQELCVCWLVD